MKTSNYLKYFFLLIIITVSFLHCKDEEKEVPLLPSDSTIVIDFSDFISMSKLYSDKAGANREFASSSLEYWDSVISVYLDLPVKTYKETKNIEKAADVTYNVWLWQKEYITGGDNINGKIYETITNKNFLQTEVFVSKNNEYLDFRWFFGKCDPELTIGNWTFHKDTALSSENFLYIEWKNRNDTVQLKYINTLKEDAKKGNYIVYRNKTDNTDFDSYFKLYYKTAVDSIEIEWNSLSKAGRIKNSTHFGDEVWHCWDGNLNDVDCN